MNTLSSTLADFVIGTKGLTANTENYGFYLYNTGTTLEMLFESYTGGFNKMVSTATGITTGQFYHVALTADGTNLTFYLNGAFLSQTAQLLALTINPTGDFQIGIGLPFGNRFDGVIDELQIHGTALTQPQIAALAEIPGGTVPEPATLLVLGTGLAAVGVRRYRRKP